MTEQEAARMLCEMLNSIERSGHVVVLGDDRLYVGNLEIPVVAPPCEDEPWEVREL